MDEFGCFDYKKPASATESDMRTSYYRGHRYITDLRLGNKLNARFCDKGIYVADPLMHEKQYSEYGANYEWKYPDPNVARNPSMNMKMQFMKPFEHGKLRFIKRRIKPITSVTQDAYIWTDVPVEAEPLPIPMPTPVEATPIIIDRAKEGYSKYLDPSATTYRLDYVHRTPRDIQSGIAAQDNVTFWNWNEHAPPTKKVAREADETMCDDFPAKDCPKRRCEYQNQLRSVPHAGLMTEVRANYLDPKYRKDYVEYDITDIQPVLTHETITPFAKKSEYSLYGSGEPVVKYV